MTARLLQDPPPSLRHHYGDKPVGRVEAVLPRLVHDPKAPLVAPNAADFVPAHLRLVDCASAERPAAKVIGGVWLPETSAR